MTAPLPVSRAGARRVLLHAQGLLDDPARRAGPAAVRRIVERLGFVQLDSINVVARAHHLTLHARLDGYRPRHLRTLHEQRRDLFEHWTHDASAIPTAYFAPWRHKCARMAERTWMIRWCRKRMGPRYRATLRRVHDRIAAEGPLPSRAFEHAGGRGGGSGWWQWKPAKAALEYLWIRGDLAVAARDGFQKVYDLTERAYPEAAAWPAPSEGEFVDRMCREALERIGAGTPAEIAGFFGAVTAAEARAWCRRKLHDGDVLEVRVGDDRRAAYAVPDWRRRVRRAERALESIAVRPRLRLLAPFDPVVRDRARAERLFGFRYRFEAFTPAAKRTYGYYVLPILQGETFAGRCDLKLHRDERRLEVRGLWWENGARATRARRAALDEALERLAGLVGATSVDG